MIDGFFEKGDLQSDQLNKGRFASCVSCGLYKYVLSPKIKPYGNFKKKVMFIGEAPGKTEDERGKPWQGDMGNMLKTALGTLGFDLFRDGISLNACNCRPPHNKTPEDHQIEACRKRVQKAIKKYKPNVIILLGYSAVQSVIGKYWLKNLGKMGRWTGWVIPDQNYNAWICPVFHPSYISRQKDDTIHKKVWLTDLKNALTYIEKPVIKQPNFAKYVDLLFTDDEVLNLFKKLKKAPFFTLDYEATSLRPYRKGNKIVCTGIATAKNKAYVWENTPKRDKAFGRILTNPNIKKIAHNVQFEDLWTSIIMKTDIKGWDWCTMNNAHILDNRSGITGLKFLTYVLFGVADYDSEISDWLKASNAETKKHGKNGINKIEKFIQKYGIKKVMEYCGLDNIFTYRLYLCQKEKFKY